MSSDRFRHHGQECLQMTLQWVVKAGRNQLQIRSGVGNVLDRNEGQPQ